METDVSKERRETTSNSFLPVQIPYPKAAASEHQLPHDCDKKILLLPSEGYGSVKLCDRHIYQIGRASISPCEM